MLKNMAFELKNMQSKDALYPWVSFSLLSYLFPWWETL